MNEKKVFAFSIIREVVISGIYLIIPLLLFERNIPLGTIAAILSALPFIFFIFRTLFGFLSDKIGYYKFFIASSTFTVASMIFYFLANNPMMFVIGKVLEGMGNSSYWAVNRLAIKSGNWAKKSQILRAVVAITGGLTLLGIGVFIEIFDFENTLMLLLFASALMFIPAIKITEKIEKKDVKIPFKLTRNSCLLGLGYMANEMVWIFALPIYLRQLNYNFFEIGVILAFSYIITGAVAYYLSKKSPLIMLAMLIEVPALILLQVESVFIPAIILWSIGYGGFISMGERILIKESKGSETPSSMIALTALPGNIGSFIGVFAAGFVAEEFGLVNVFLFACIIFLIFGVTLERDKKHFH